MRTFFAILLLGYGFAHAQVREEIIPEEFAERFFQMQEDDLNYEDLYESLLMLYAHPINLNKATPEELRSLNILNPSQINAFFQHVAENGKLISLYELQSIPLFTAEIIQAIRSFVSVVERKDNSTLIERIRSEENNYLLLRYGRTLQQQKGYQNTEGNRFLGDPNQLYARYRIASKNDFSLGITAEKDAGERWMFNDSLKTYLFDFYSFHLMIQDKGPIQTFIVGDYQVQLGQGLVLGSGFGFGKGAETILTTKRNSLGIRPYTSALESGFFRGAGLAVRMGNFNTTWMYSNLDQDARSHLDTTYSAFDEYVSSIQETGYHRTPTELAAKNQLNEQAFGTAVQYNLRQLNVGATLLMNQFSLPIHRRPNRYNQFEFSGTENLAGSFYGSFLWRNLNLFGEVAQSSSVGRAAYGGVIASISPEIDLSITARNYDKNFHSFYGNGFGENSRIINEKGIYWGIKIKPSRKITLAAYYDQFSFPWMKFGVYAPSKGYEYLGRVSYHLSRSVQFYLQYREESKGKSIQGPDANLNMLATSLRRNFIFNADYQLDRFSMKTRIQGSTFSLGTNNSSGIAIIQDFGYSIGKLRLNARAALFDSDYENRIYAFEKDVLYAFSIPAYSGAGLRTYVVIKYAVSKKISVWVKYGQFSYDSAGIGSGLTAIEGSQKADLRAMLRLRL